MRNGLPQEGFFSPRRRAPSAVWTLSGTLLPHSGPFRSVGVNFLAFFIVRCPLFCVFWIRAEGLASWLSSPPPFAGCRMGPSFLDGMVFMSKGLYMGFRPVSLPIA